MIIVLMGYMGSGKSFIGKELASSLNYKFVDLDNYIESRENLSISDIFDKKGAIYFRKIESKYLQELLKFKDNIILALGGGTPCYGENLALLRENDNVKSIYLKASVNHLSNTLLTEKDKRPLLSGIETLQEMQEFVGKHLFERAPIYANADETVVNENKDVKKIVEEIILLLF